MRDRMEDAAKQSDRVHFNGFPVAAMGGYPSTLSAFCNDDRGLELQTRSRALVCWYVSGLNPAILQMLGLVHIASLLRESKIVITSIMRESKHYYQSLLLFLFVVLPLSFLYCCYSHDSYGDYCFSFLAIVMNYCYYCRIFVVITILVKGSIHHVHCSYCTMYYTVIDFTFAFNIAITIIVIINDQTSRAHLLS